MTTIRAYALQLLLSSAHCKLDSVTFRLLVALWALLLAVAVSYVHICIVRMYICTCIWTYIHVHVCTYICSNVRITAKLLHYTHCLSLTRSLSHTDSDSRTAAAQLLRTLTLCEDYRKSVAGETFAAWKSVWKYQIEYNLLNCLQNCYANTIIKKTLPLLIYSK